MLFANVCAGFISSYYGELFFLAFWFLLGVMCIWRVLALLLSQLCTRLGYIGVPPAGHTLWAEVGGSITFVTSGENT